MRSAVQKKQDKSPAPVRGSTPLTTNGSGVEPRIIIILGNNIISWVKRYFTLPFAPLEDKFKNAVHGERSRTMNGDIKYYTFTNIFFFLFLNKLLYVVVTH